MTDNFSLAIDVTWLEHITPYYIVWNRQGQRVHMSPKAARFYSLENEFSPSTDFRLIRPFNSPFEPSLFPELTNLILYLSIDGLEQQVLKGELVELDDENGWLFSGLPPAASIAELDTYGVKLSELPLHLGIGDFLLANEATLVLLAESARTNEELQRSSDELRQYGELLEEKSAQLSREVDQHQIARNTLEKTLHELETMQSVVVQQERLKAMGEMVSGIAHDFNNLLTPITAYSAMLKTSETIAERERQEYLDVIMTAANDAAALIQRLRRLYKPDAESSSYSSFAVDRLVDDALALVYPKWASRPHVKAEDITVWKEYNATGELIGIQSDIRQALVNLLDNGADALRSPGTIKVTTDSNEDMVWVSVMDTGSGMTAAVLEQCKTPFFSTKGEYGTGLGLPMVFESALRHGGRVVIESEFGKGSRITLVFPRSQSQSDTVGSSISRAALSARIETRIGLDMTNPFRLKGLSIDGLKRELADSSSNGARKTEPGFIKMPVAENTLSTDALVAELSSVPKIATYDVEDRVNSSSLHILIVDDDYLIRQALSRTFVSEGHQVFLAEDGKQAFGLCKKQAFDLIICDVDMPHLRGDDFAVKFRAQWLHSVIILYTGNLDGIHAAGRAAADKVLLKPTNAVSILQTGIDLIRSR